MSRRKPKNLRRQLQMAQLTKRFRQVLIDIKFFRKGQLKTTPAKEFLRELENEEVK